MIRTHRGRLPRIPSSVFVDDSAQVIGDVEIGEESSVWMCVVIRGDVNWIRIGKRSNVQDGTIVHGCTIEDQCLIGMGAILLNGATVGTGSIVAAGTLLVEGAKIPPRSLVMGSPGKVKRTLSDAEVADIQAYADRYVGYRLDYMVNV